MNGLRTPFRLKGQSRAQLAEGEKADDALI